MVVRLWMLTCRGCILHLAWRQLGWGPVLLQPHKGKVLEHGWMIVYDNIGYVICKWNGKVFFFLLGNVPWKSTPPLEGHSVMKQICLACVFRCHSIRTSRTAAVFSNEAGIIQICREENMGNFTYREKQKHNCRSLNQIKIENNHRQEKKDKCSLMMKTDLQNNW